MTELPVALRAMPEVSERVRELHAQMTLEEKLAQLVGYWLDQGGNVVAPMQGEMAGGQGCQRAPGGDRRTAWATTPACTARDRWTRRSGRRGSGPSSGGSSARRASASPRSCTRSASRAWRPGRRPPSRRRSHGARRSTRSSWPEMGGLIGESMRELGIHQGLAPVLDVVRDPRWGRVDECIGEDPYLVGTVGTSYVRGLQGAGVHATLKHFVAYSGSKAGRNHAPVQRRPARDRRRLPPAVRDGACSTAGCEVVMSVLQRCRRRARCTRRASTSRTCSASSGGSTASWSPTTSRVAFLTVMHAIAADRGAAAAAALEAGVDVELPSGDAYLQPLAAPSGRVRAGRDSGPGGAARAEAEGGARVSSSLTRTRTPHPPSSTSTRRAHRDVARRLAEESVVLLSNDGVLPLGSWHDTPARMAVIGPNAAPRRGADGLLLVREPRARAPSPASRRGSRSRRWLTRWPSSSTVRACPRPSSRSPAAATSRVTTPPGSRRRSPLRRPPMSPWSSWATRPGCSAAAPWARATTASLWSCPACSVELVEAVLAAGKPVVMVLITGRPYAVGWALDASDEPARSVRAPCCRRSSRARRAAARSPASSPAGVNPSGRLPVSLPRSTGSQPYSYLHPILGGASEVTADRLDAAARLRVRPVIHDVRARAGLRGPAGRGGRHVQRRRDGHQHGCGGGVRRRAAVRARRARLHRTADAQLLGYHRVTLEPGESTTVTFDVPTTRFAFTDRSMTRVVEPGDVEVWVGAHAADSVVRVVAEGIADLDEPNDAPSPDGAGTPPTTRKLVTITGDPHEVTTSDPRWVRATTA